MLPNGESLRHCPRTRRELQFEQVASAQAANGGQPRWIVFDPITRKTFRIGWTEYWLLQHLDGTRTIEQLTRALSQSPLWPRDSGVRVKELIAQFRNGELLYENATEVNRRRRSNNRWSQWVSSIVTWRVRGIRADAWLERLAPHANWLFSKSSAFRWMAFGVLTLVAVLLNHHQLAEEISGAKLGIRPQVAGLLMMAFLATRACHELGHAVLAKRMGVRCPDMGILFILGAPCVYCDVSESWKLPHRWQRAAIAAAGMYVEFIVAALAAWLWLLTYDGLLHTLAFQCMLVCSVSTLLVNANPLMRFDGYYILADWLDEAHLRQKADGIALNAFRSAVLGTRGKSSFRSRREMGLMTYSIASCVYRGLLTLGIATVMVSIYTSWNLSWIGRLLAIILVVSMWGMPIVNLIRNLTNAAQTLTQRFRLVGLAAALLLFVFYVPIPQRRYAAGWVQPEVAQGVFANSTARLLDYQVNASQSVEQGQPLFQLSSAAMLVRAIEQKSAADRALARLELQRRQRDMYGEDIDLSIYESDVNAARVLSGNAQRQVDALLVRAPAKGRFCACSAELSSGVVETNDSPSGHLTWCSREQLGRTVPQGTRLGTICSDEVVAVLPLNDSELGQLTKGTEVRLSVAGSHEVIRGVQVASLVHLDEVPSYGAFDSHLPTPWGLQPGALGAAEGGNRFAVIVRLPEELHGTLPGTRVEAVLITPPITLSDACRRWAGGNLKWFAD